MVLCYMSKRSLPVPTASDQPPEHRHQCRGARKQGALLQPPCRHESVRIAGLSKPFEVGTYPRIAPQCIPHEDMVNERIKPCMVQQILDGARPPHEVRSLDRRHLLAHFRVFALEHAESPVHEEDGVRDLQHLRAGTMQRDHDRHVVLLSDLHEKQDDLCGGGAVEPCVRLIKEEREGVVQKPDAYLKPSLLAARHLVDELVGVLQQADELERVLNLLNAVQRRLHLRRDHQSEVIYHCLIHREPRHQIVAALRKEGDVVVKEVSYGRV
mmetsp:Transcript_17348/g.42398  ORF Transcript_17348/g.42398 Transcript_17348/m.42398 type:complete len:269 (-) Transcript_17348:118-924(-)